MAVSEVDVLKAVDDALRSLTEVGSCERVLRWAWAKYVPDTASPATSPQPNPAASPKERKSGGKRKTSKGSAGTSGKAQGASRKPRSVGMVRDLNLKPKGKTSFADFVAEKKPSTNYEKATVAVYYLKTELDIPTVTVSHVFTCFKDAHWRVPPDLPNALALTAHRKGWLDTRNLEDISVTTHGENLIEHDLPRKATA